MSKAKEPSVSYVKDCEVKVTFTGKVVRENRDGSYDIKTEDGVVTNVHKSYLGLIAKAIKAPAIIEKNEKNGKDKAVAHSEVDEVAEAG